MTTTTAYYPSYGHPLQAVPAQPVQSAPAVAAHPTTTVAALPATAMGVPLLPGERVVYFYEARGSSGKQRPPVQVVTTLRIIDVPGQGTPVSLWLQSIRAMEAARGSSRGGAAVASLVTGFGGIALVGEPIGGLLGAAIGLLIGGIIDSAAKPGLDRRPKTTERYWHRSEAVVLVAHDRRRYRVATKDAVRLGLLLASGMEAGGFDHVPSVWYRA